MSMYNISVLLSWSHLLLFAFVFCTIAAFSTHVIKLLYVFYCIHQICSIGTMFRCVHCARFMVWIEVNTIC